ncbi:MAG: hypothetical protein NZM04_00250, partial [Methylacidiphilales bacterium]|nr:hypothetical protein [Candidatus Methylacidiphilales bacterium]
MHENVLGSTVRVTNPSGDEMLRAQYDVYGRVRFLQNGQPYYNHTMTRFWYTGREMLVNEYGGIGAGLYDLLPKPIQSAASGAKEGSPLPAMHYRNRIYSTVRSRFLQPDPIGFEAGDVNWYRYVGNGVVNYIDPMGLISSSTGYNPFLDRSDDFSPPDYLPVDASSNACGCCNDEHIDALFKFSLVGALCGSNPLTPAPLIPMGLVICVNA